MIKKIAFVFFSVIMFHSCSTVKEYEKEKINDPEMKLTAKIAERYETSFQVYREAAAGANGGKSGGGCGCN
jgi:PBP1b-binding outer membrane lipoprotein LpoB